MIDVASWSLIALVAALLIVHRQFLRAIWFRVEDPRTVALFRIGSGAVLLAHLVAKAPIYEYLYGEEGFVTGEQARAMFGRGKTWSPLYEFGSLEFVQFYVGVQWLACGALMIGLATPIAKWLTWFLLLGTLALNSLDIGGDQVFTSFLFLLCLSRCGESYSVDAWIRKRRDPKVASHRPIPGWPRNLMLLQMIPMLFANGLAKSGPMWRNGDMVYYIFNHPSFRPMPMWEVSAVFGTNLFRVMTWVLLGFELLFPLAIVGLIVEFARRHPPAPLGSRARWLSHALTFAVGAVICWLAWWRWRFAWHMPSVVTMAAGITIGLAPLTIRLARRVPTWMHRAVLGPRLWAGILVLFGAQLFFILRVGMWTGVTLCTALLLFEGDALVRGWARLRRRVVEEVAQDRTGDLRPLQRRFVAVLSGLHVIAIAAALLPRGEPTPDWRRSIERPLQQWVRLTVRFQFWRMFAKSTVNWTVRDLDVVVRDRHGNGQSLGDGILPPGDTRALIRREKAPVAILDDPAYQKRHARWVCRRFAPPGDEFTVYIYLVKATLPAPEVLEEIGADGADDYIAASQIRTLLLTYSCGPTDADSSNPPPP